MDLGTTQIVILVAGGLFGVRWLNAYIKERKANPLRLPLPPGPKGYPIIGNLLDMPTDKAWLVYDQWSKIYGDMIYVKVLGQGFLILGSAERTYDLFEKRSSNYADRPRMPMLVESMGWDYNFGLFPYGNMWRHHRRTFRDHFHPNVVDKYYPIQLSAARAFLRYLLKEPEDFMQLIRLTFAETVMKAVYGIAVTGMQDPYVKDAEEALAGIAEAGIPGTFLVDMFPIMKWIPGWFPGAEWKRKADRWKATNYNVVYKPFEFVKQRVKDGIEVPCIVTSMLQALPDEDSPQREAEETAARGSSAVAYATGSDTTVSSVQSFFLAMCMYPEVQTKAQAELDAICQGRLPEFNDRPSLPYINALVKETLRWQPVVPLGLAHMVTNDDEYHGYYIPGGTVVLGNAWSILHDPEAFNDPLEFQPERYLKDGEINKAVRDPAVAAFGFGRRICAGRFFSDNSLFSIIAHVLTVFDIKPGLDKNGKEEKIRAEVTDGVLSYPAPFPCRIIPRSETAEMLIRNSELMEDI